MIEKEIAEFMNMTIPELLSYCQNRATATTILSLAIQKGIRKGQEQTCLNYNRAMLFSEYDEVSIFN